MAIIAANISGSGTLEAVGNTFLGGTLNVSGNVALGDTAADVTTNAGQLTASQGAYFADRVGIGTATPHSSSILHLSYANAIVPPPGGPASGGGLRIENTNAAGGATIHMRSNDADGFITYHKTGQNNKGDFHFHAESTERALIISSSGDVLVPSGSLSGSSTLEIVGNTYLGGTLNVTGAVALATQTTGSAAGPSSFLAVNASGVVILDEPAGGGGSPGGSDTQVQFNDGGSALGGDAGLTYVKGTDVLSGSGQWTIGGGLITTGDISGSGTLEVGGNATLGGNLNVSGAQVVNRTAATTTYSVTATDYYIGCNTNGGAFTVTLPATSGLEGRILCIKDEQGEAGTNTLTLSCSNAETLDGQTTRVIDTNYSSLTMVSDGSNWFII